MSNQNDSEYQQTIAEFRTRRDEDLRAPDSWLSLTGLFILSEGIFTIGSAADNDIALPGSAPERLGVLEFKDQKATLRVTSEEPVLISGIPQREAHLKDNSNRKPTLVTAGSTIFFIHHWADQYAVRIKDTSNSARQAFKGNSWFDINPDLRVQGRYVRFDKERSVPIDTILHFPSTYKASGAVEFELDGHSHSLLAADYGLGSLTIAFRDATGGQQTYQPVRFLNVSVDADDSVDVDFNKAVNPPCAYTPFATCPLPPHENVLAIPIAAGELYGDAVKDIYASLQPVATELQPA